MKSIMTLCLALLLLLAGTLELAAFAGTKGYNNGKAVQHRKIVKHRRHHHRVIRHAHR